MARTQLQMLSRLASDMIQGESDAALVARFAEGADHDAFAELVHRYGRLVWGQCRYLLANADDADDAFQATFLALARSARSIRAGALGPWLHAVAYRVCLKVRRAATRRKHRERIVAAEEGIRPVADSVWDRAAAALHEEVQRLPDALRVPFVMCCLEGLEPTAAAKQLGLKWGTFSARLSRAKERLIERLARRDIGAGAVAVVGTIGFGPTAPAAIVERATLLGTGAATIPASVLSLCSGVNGMARFKSKLFLMLGLALATFGSAALVPPEGGPAAPAGARAAPPLPADKAAKERELERLWAELAQADPAGSSAVLALFLQPEHTVPFLRTKLQPLKLDEKRCKELLIALGSNEEKTWKAAWAELDYLDPRLAIDLKTLMNDVTENPARTRLVELCSERDAGSLSGENINIRALDMDEGFNFFSETSGSWWAEHKIERIGVGPYNPKKSWLRAVRAAVVLEHIGTPEARKVLEQLATGHPDAIPTKTAKASLERLKKR